MVKDEKQNYLCESASQVDLMSIDAYKKGLCDFIASCYCPMTIAIQGDWGTGKTSMMQMIQAELTASGGTKADKKASNCVCVSINTWQYSQFNLSDQLPAVFYQSVIEKIATKNDNKLCDGAKEILKESFWGLVRFGCKVIHDYAPGIVNDAVDSTLGAVESVRGHKSEEKTVVQIMDGLRAGFLKVVDKRLKEEEKERIVIFVDDLDRIEPARAVELMEIMKTMFECDRCIFVLAIDYGVVLRGVKEKYGEDLNESKARNFFDKIIQVPFSLPVGKYKISDYVCKLIASSNNRDIFTGLEPREILDLIQYSVGCNPRAIKRLLNTYALLMHIEKLQQNKARVNIVLFASLCMQLTFSSVYECLLASCSSYDATVKFFSMFADLETLNGIDELTKQKIRFHIFSEVEKESLIEFMDTFLDKLDGCVRDMDDQTGAETEEQNEILSKKAYEVLKSVLSTSTATAVSTAPVQTTVREADSSLLNTKNRDYYEILRQACRLQQSGTELTDADVKEIMKSVNGDRSPSCVLSECTRGLGISVHEFHTQVLRFAKNGSQEIVETIVRANKAKNVSDDALRTMFMDLRA